MSAGDFGETSWELHGGGPPVALIHGFGLNRGMWRWQLPVLTPHFRVLSYDLLGHGASAPPAGTPDLAMFSGQLLRLMDRCGIERSAVVGFSLGGMIARRFALDHPDRLSALAILHSAHDRTPAERAAGVQRVDERRPGLQRILAPTPSDNARTPSSTTAASRDRRPGPNGTTARCGTYPR